jgi:hypothetical protein
MKTRDVLTMALVVIGLGSLLAFWISPVLRTPALVKDPYAITEALSDALANSVYQVANGQDVFASGERSKVGGGHALCNSLDVSQAGLADRQCHFAMADQVSDCQNAYRCAGLRVHPTILADKKLRAAVESALANPCRALPETSGDPAEPIVSTLTHPYTSTASFCAVTTVGR